MASIIGNVVIRIRTDSNFVDFATARAALSRIIADQPWNEDAKEALQAVDRIGRRSMQIEGVGDKQ